MLCVVRGDDKAPGDHESWGASVVAGRAPAPHETEKLELRFQPTEQPDDTSPFFIWYRVGGGGGHSLSIRGLEVFACTMGPGVQLLEQQLDPEENLNERIGEMSMSPS